MDEKLTAASTHAETYATLVKQEWALARTQADAQEKDVVRSMCYLIVRQAATFGPMEMAHFCQQVGSYFSDGNTISSVLTAFCHRLQRVLE